MAPAILKGEDAPQPAVELQESPVTNADRDYWAFRPLRTVAPPRLENGEWIRNPIDSFILAKLGAAGLEPLPSANKLTLIRRVTFDLTGLPPAPDELDQFLADESPDSFERLIDRLLASPAYGPHWAQHWLDLARFAESDGFEHDLIRPNAWRYREWVIDALNRDLPYDEFVRLQIAGDELDPQSPAHAIATGFLLAGPDMPDVNDQAERRHNVLNEMTATVGSVFLGLQLGCAQCHDHKFDPLSQADFYRFRAFFESTDLFREHPIPTPAERERRLTAEREGGGVAKQLSAELTGLEETARGRLREKNPDADATEANLLANLTAQEQARRMQLTAELAKIKKLPDLPHGRVMRDTAPQPTHLMLRGDFQSRGPLLSPDFLRVVNFPRQAVPPSVAGVEGTRQLRIELADWITRADHPLTTRVLVNRLWQAHFGEGIVRSPSDFGNMGHTPSHPELLDWLAQELPRQGWSWKRMHKLLLTSATYRQASGAGSIAANVDEKGRVEVRWERSRQLDPENRLWGRFSRRRLEGEVIRDAMLAAANSLSQRRGGMGVCPPLPPEITSTLLANQWTVSPDPEDHRRRSIYLLARRNLRYPLFEIFDRPDSAASCPQRSRTTIASQALVLLNSEAALAAARLMSGMLLEQADGDRELQIRLCYQRALGRLPGPAELIAAQEFLSKQTAELETQRRPLRQVAAPIPLPLAFDFNIYEAAALTHFCLAIFNLNEFVYVD